MNVSFFKTLMVGAMLITVSSSLEAGGLDPEDRPDEITQNINLRFQELERYSDGNWNIHSGSSTYNHLNIDLFKFARKIIEDAAAYGRHDVYILDSGAGGFQSCDAFEEFINDSRYVLPPNMKVYIIGTRGETYLGKEVETKGICTLYKLGGFKIEEHTKELLKRGLNLKGKIDLTI